MKTQGLPITGVSEVMCSFWLAHLDADSHPSDHVHLMSLGQPLRSEQLLRAGSLQGEQDGLPTGE